MMPKIDLPESVLDWLAFGERGMSSETIVYVLYGLPAGRRNELSHPYDPDDLKRCLRLLAASPETKARFGEMRLASKEWKALVARWDELEALFLEEAGDLDWSTREPATKTYYAMQECLACRTAS